MKKSLSLFVAIFGALSLTPMFAFAQNVQGVLGIVLGLINTVIVILIIAAVMFFIYAVVMYILGKGERKQILNGLVGLFVIVAFWGVIKIVQNTFGLDNNNQIQQQDIPCVQGINC